MEDLPREVVQELILTAFAIALQQINLASSGFFENAVECNGVDG